MAGGSNIRAGAAFVEVSLKDSFSKPLKAMGQQLKQFGASVANIGAGVGAAGAAITAPFVAGVKAFADFGSAVYDAGQRSGLSAELISTLQYAAEQTGSSLGDVETAAKKLNVTVAGAAKGEKASVDALKGIGLAYEDLAGLSPDQQFRKVAAALAGVTDNATQVAAAVDLFGKSGINILPLARDFASLEANAKRLGLVMSGTDAAAADALGDSFKDLELSVSSTFRALGAAIAGPAKEFSEWAISSAGEMRAWIGENKDLVITVAKFGAVLTIAGTALVTFGLAVNTVGKAVLGLEIAFTAMSSVVNKNPIGGIAISCLAAAAAGYELGKALDSVGVSLDKIGAVKTTLDFVARGVEDVGASEIAIASLRLRKEAGDMKNEFAAFKKLNPGKNANQIATPKTTIDDFSGIDALESGGGIIAQQQGAQNKLSSIFGQISAPFKAIADAMSATADPIRGKGSQSFSVAETVYDFTKKSFESEGAFAGLNLASFIGGAPDDAADDTARNTSEMIKKQDKTNNILDKIYNTGGLTFS